MIKRILPTLTALSLALTLSLGMLTITAGNASAAAPGDPGSSAAAVKRCQSAEGQAVSESLGLNMGECVNFFAGQNTENISRVIIGLCGSPFSRAIIASSLGFAPFANKGACISTLGAFFRVRP